MRYLKPPLSVDAQADLLIARGLDSDKTSLVLFLKHVNYYRLSAYLYPFRLPQSDSFRAETRFQLVRDTYAFDRHLRLIAMDAIERIEVSLKTTMTQIVAERTGAFGYLNNATFPCLNQDEHRRLLKKIRKQRGSSQEKFVRHYNEKYVTEGDLPLWMAIEIMDFGCLFTMFRGLSSKFQKLIASQYSLHHVVLESWIRTFNFLRNLCAHHGRLWNRVLPYPLVIPHKKHHPKFHDPIGIVTDRVFGVFTAAQYLLQTIGASEAWTINLRDLIVSRNPGIPLLSMGFPEHWEEHSLWQYHSLSARTAFVEGNP